MACLRAWRRAAPRRVTTKSMTDFQASRARDQQSEQIRAQAEQMRKQADEMREQAEQMREQAQHIREQARQAAEEALRRVRVEGQPGVVVAPRPQPFPHGQETHTGVPPWRREPDVPPEVVDIIGMLTFGTAAVLILRPLMRAFANRFERRGAPLPALPPEVSAHMQRLEQAIEAVAIEVERISEGQRFTTKLLAEQAGKEKVG
jgi:hypothetical protein